MLRDGASSITWAAHAEIDGSTCIRDNAPCRTGSFGRLTFFHAAPRIAPLITNTVSCLCPPFPPPLSHLLPPSHPARSTSFTRERRAPARAPPLPSPLLLRRFRRTCPSRSFDSIAPPTPRLKRFKKFEHRRRCFERGGRANFGKDLSKKKIFRPTRHLFANFETNSAVYLKPRYTVQRSILSPYGVVIPIRIEWREKQEARFSSSSSSSGLVARRRRREK